MRKVLFVPGYIATKKVYSPWLEKMARRYGIDLEVHEREYSALLDSRARKLKNEILELYNGFGKIDVVGHSRGGTDLTYTLFKYPHLRRNVRSVTTMASPHAGSLLADLTLDPHCSLTFNALNFAVDIMNEEGTVRELTKKFMLDLKIKQIEGVDYHAFTFWAYKKKMPLPGGIDNFTVRSDGTLSTTSQSYGFYYENVIEMEACHKSQTLPFLYGPPIIRWFVKPYKKIWKKVFTRIARM
jgi:pimeloyl-ACP methyl ester carboxylesterase